MKRFLRIAAVVAAAVVLLLVAAGVAVRFLLPPEKASALLSRQLESRLGRQVKLGSAALRGVSTFAVTSIQISEMPTFEAGTLLTADSLQVEARLLPLLFGRIAINEIALVKPRVTVIRRADGSTNLSGPPSGSPHPAGQAKVKASDFLISEVRVEDGALTFVDESTAALSAVADPINVRLRHVTLGSAFSAAGTMGLSMKDIRANLAFDAKLNAASGNAQLARFSVSAASGTVNASGRVDDAFSASPKFDLVADWAGVRPSALAGVAPLPEGLVLDGPTSGKLKLTGNRAAPNGTVTLDLTAAEVKWTDLFDKPAGTALTLVLGADRKESGDVNVRDLAVKLASLELRGDGNVRGADTTAPLAAFRFETNDFEIADLFRHLKADMPTDLKLDGITHLKASVNGWTGGGRFVTDIDGTRLLAAYGSSFIKPVGVPLRVVTEGRYATPLAVDMSSFRMDLAAMTMNGSGSYTPGKVRPTYTFLMKTNAFPIESVAALAPAARDYAPAGQAVVNMRVTRGETEPVISGQATLVSVSAKAGGAALTELAGTFDFKGDAVSTGKLTGKLEGEPMQLSLSARGLSGRPFIQTDVRVTAIDLDKLLPAAPKPPQKTDGRRWEWAIFPVAVAHAAEPAAPLIFDTKGSFHADRISHANFEGGDLNVSWDLTSVTPDLTAVSGTAKLRQGAGTARKLGSLMEGSKAARILGAPLAILQKLDKASRGALKLAALEQLAFNSIAGDYALKNGLMTIAPFALDGKEVSARMEGTMDFKGAQPIQMRAQVTARASQLSGPIGQALAAAAGDRQSFKLKISGTINEPDITIDQEALKEKAIDVLRRLGGGAPDEPAAPADPATAPADAPAKKPESLEDAAKDLLKGILKRR